MAITGADPHTAGTLKPPSNAYASFIPPFQRCVAGVPGLCGGNFWNGRSEGRPDRLFPAGATEHIGVEVFENAGNVLDPNLKADYEKYLGPVADQALNPFGNPVEQNIERAGVCEHVKSSKFAPLFETVWKEAIDCSPAGVDKSFKRIAVALSAWQASAEVNSFSSKRDKALAAATVKQFPLSGLTAQENLGHDLFYNTLPLPFAPEGNVEFPPGTGNIVPNFRPFSNLSVTNCSFCHMNGPRFVPAGQLGTDPQERYTDDAYHNIGTPPNPEIPGYPVPNAGLAGHTGCVGTGNDGCPPVQGPGGLAEPDHRGFHKTPTLRNVDKRPGKGFPKAYTHNGWFKSMESIVHFYNTADVNPPGVKLHTVTRCPDGVTTEKDALARNCWPAPEVSGPGIAIGAIFGNLGLTPQQEAAIVAYLKTLTDAYTPKQPKPYK